MTQSKGIEYNVFSRQLTLKGNWILQNINDYKNQLEQINFPKSGEIIFNGKDINQMDSAGAWLIHEWKQKLNQQNIITKIENFSDQHQQLLTLIDSSVGTQEIKLPEVKQLSWLALVGKTSIHFIKEFQVYLNFIGQLTYEFIRILPKPFTWRLNALVNIIFRDGYQALPIIALLSFMIGVVITYQMGLQLRNYGANIYIVDLLGISILREFAPLLTAIMVAGRTGSAFTAQLGTMKINQEIDALNTLGVTPSELLILPRVFGLLIALPLLTIWSDIFGIIGGMAMSNNTLGVTWVDFMNRFPHVIKLKNLLIGLGKAPIFALIIASIGCFEGMRVERSADSIGINTTRSVVMAIFFIIVADAIFSVFFSKMKL